MVPEIAVNLVEELKEQIPIYQICFHLGIPRSTYYRWKQHSQQDTR
ncbi:helix-turn-helix domain-containing protein, partial [Escherichia coli]